MKRLIGLLAILALAVGVAMLLELGWGNITFWVPPYRIDMSMQAAVIGLLGLLAVTLLMIRFAAALLGIPDRVRRYRRQRQQNRRLKTLAELIVDFFEGRFARVIKASNDLKQDASLYRDVPAAAAAANAVAASAAHQLNDPVLRDTLIHELGERAIEGQPEDRTLAALLEAEFALDDRKGSRALAALAPLTKGDRRHVHTLRLLLKANQQQANWPEVLRLTRLLENRKALTPVVAVQYKRQVASAWIGVDRHADAIALIEATLRDYWDSGLAMLYGRCIGNPKEQLLRLEHWLQQHPLDAELNWSLGRICQRQKLWGKARMHLEASLRAKPMMATHLALAEIAEALNEKETAASHWKAAAQMTS